MYKDVGYPGKRFCEAERNHRGLGNALIEPEEGVGACRGDIQCRERLGG